MTSCSASLENSRSTTGFLNNIVIPGEARVKLSFYGAGGSNVGIDSYNQRQAGLTQLNSGIPLTTKPDGVTQKEWENYLKLRDSNPEWFTTSGNKLLLKYKTYPYKLDVDTSWLNIPFNNHGIV